MPCQHPLSALKPESVRVADNGTVTVRFACTSLLGFMPEAIRGIRRGT
jgi:hypothetical protein